MNINKITGYVKNSYLNGDAKSLLAFYKEGMTNPSLALVAERDFVLSRQDKFVKNGYGGYSHFNNLECKYRLLKEDKSLKSVIKGFWKSFKKLYPRTAILRTILCKMGRIRMDKVTPKADLFEKNYIAYSLKIGIRDRVVSDNYLIIKI